MFLLFALSWEENFCEENFCNEIPSLNKVYAYIHIELNGLKTITNPLIQISDKNTMQTMRVKLLAYLMVILLI